MTNRTPSRGPAGTLLGNKLAQKIPAIREAEKQLLKEHGDKTIADVTIAQAYRGMRDVRCMVTQTSAVDPYEGIRFRGYTIPEVRAKMPKAPGGDEPLPEGVFCLLLTGEIPTREEVDEISAIWRANETLPPHVKTVLDGMPADADPMTQFSLGILAMQPESIFARRYREGLARTDQWEAMFDDSMLLLGRLPALAAYIYRRSYHGGEHVEPADRRLDWGGNLAHLLGVESDEFKELMRLYLTLHADHEGGNVSAHTTHLVGSALNDPYRALSAGMNGLAGPLHGLANREVVRWIERLKADIGSTPGRERIEEYVRNAINGGQSIPGYGHTMLRRTDPRFTAQREFALRHLPDDENFRIVQLLYEVVPGILKELCLARNPWPDADAHSGCLLIHYGIEEHDFQTVLVGVSRAMGVLASLIWDRAEMLPLERPKSFSTEWIRGEVGKP